MYLMLSAKVVKNLERGTTPENVSIQTRSGNPCYEIPIVTRSSDHCERPEKNYNAQKQDYESEKSCECGCEE